MKWARYADQITELGVTAWRKTPKKPPVSPKHFFIVTQKLKNAPTISATKAKYCAEVNKTTAESSLKGFVKFDVDLVTQLDSLRM